MYGDDFFINSKFKRIAKAYLECLPNEVTHLVSQGSSGCAIASAMLVLCERELKHVFVRKEGEKAHCQGSVGWRPSYPEDVAAVVDDLVSTGETVRTLLDWDRKISGCVRYVIVNYFESFSSCLQIERRYPVKCIEVRKNTETKRFMHAQTKGYILADYTREDSTTRPVFPGSNCCKLWRS